MRKTYASMLLAAIVGLGACAGSAPTVAPRVTTTLAPVSTTTVTALPATTTTTAAPSTTVAVETTTTAPPTAAPVSEEAAIRQAVLDYEEARYACISAPPECDPTTVARGAQLQATQEFLDTAIALNARGRRRDDDPDYWVIDTVTPAPDGLSADLNGCYWDSGVLEGTAGVPINDQNASLRTTIHLVKEDGRWWVERITLVEAVRDQNVCGPRS